MRGAPNEMQGAPVTMQVTLPTSRLLSLMTRVVLMTPLMSSADAVRAGRPSNVPTKRREPSAHTWPCSLLWVGDAY